MTYQHRVPMLFPTPTDPLAAFGPLVARRTPEGFDNRPYECFSLAPVTPTIGAEISGLRLGGDLSDETLAELRRALLEWKVLFFRDQAIDRACTATLPCAGACWSSTRSSSTRSRGRPT